VKGNCIVPLEKLGIGLSGTLDNRIVVTKDVHQGREIIAIVALENGAFCTVFSENFHKF
jgi:hypothetical protein